MGVKELKTMRSMILFVGMATSALASNLFVPGEPPLTTEVVQNVTGVVEWLIGGNLTPQQRDAVEQVMINSWQQQNTTQIGQWVQLSNLRYQLDTLNENQRSAVRGAVLSQIQKQGNPLTNLVSSGPPPASAGGSSALLGKWEQRSGSSSITYRDSVTGSYAAPTGNINRYTFTPDGQYEYAELHQVSTYGCTTGYFGYERGSYSVQGERITFAQREHSLEFKSTCNPSLNSNKNLPLSTQSYAFGLERGQYGPELVLTDGKTARWRFSKAQ
jgi:hypothetical protein